MRKHLITLFLGCIVVAAAALTANAQMHGGMGGPGKGMMMEGMGPGGMGMMQGMGGGMMMADDHALWKHVMDLNLDEKQTAAIKAVRTKTMKDMIRKKADQQILHIELKDLLDKDPVDMKAVEALVKKCESIRTEMLLAHIRMREEVKALLTAEQKKKLKEMLEAGHGACGMDCGMMHGGEGHKEAKPSMPQHMH
jgi:Spy/CpxP family protein refolding chaperone